jgi:predicted enzyme related to lactoylglutathione lyase
MGERTSYPPGTFSWAELATSDAEAATSFYSALFGWDYDDNPIPEGGVYSMAKRDGKNVAALFGSEEPPHLELLRDGRIGRRGGGTRQRTRREGGGGAVRRDGGRPDGGDRRPGRAALCLWEPRASIGATLVNAPGAMTWNDLLTPDAEAAAGFYGELFGWTTEEMPDSGGYRVIRNGERGNGGIMPLDPEGMGANTPPSWMPYFGHEDVERLVKEVDGLSGRVFNGPIRLPHGTFAVLGDPRARRSPSGRARTTTSRSF